MYKLEQDTLYWPFGFNLSFAGQPLTHVVPAHYTIHDKGPADVLAHPETLHQYHLLQFMVDRANEYVEPVDLEETDFILTSDEPCACQHGYYHPFCSICDGADEDLEIDD